MAWFYAAEWPTFAPPLTSDLWALPGETEEQSWERHQQSFLPQGEAQTPEDMGQMVVYMACAPHLTGQALAVDGGFSLG